jgi:hypothetical protein
MIWRAILSSPIVKWLGAALAAIAGIWAYGRAREQRGRQRGAEEAAEADAKEYQETRREMDEAPKPADPAAAREWLRNRKPGGSV